VGLTNTHNHNKEQLWVNDGGEMKRVTIYAILLLALWWISAQSAAAQSTTLHVGFNGFYGAAPLYVAQDAGIFRKHLYELG
jgi:ABC-type nitrate/sulfonate/bicarbonate transport system substrate-binding protein